jgi:uracil-DNA glycosylase family 4
MEQVDFTAEQLRRAVVQQLESLRRAGVTHWKQIDPIAALTQQNVVRSESVSAASAPFLQASSAKSAPPIAASVLSLREPQSPPSVDSESSEVAKKKASLSAPATVPRAPFEPLNLPLAERISGLKILSEKVKACTRCPELASTRTQTVFGVGNPEAKILFVGEAPGADEDAQGEPFVGRSGQLLNDIIKACRLRREDIYICNVLRCRPPGNRLPAPDECANCREFLDGQIAHVNPQYIVCWGACAAQNVLSSTESIGKLRKRFFTYGNAKVICTYHPSYLMRNPSAKKDVWDDMKMLFLDMGIDLTKKE